MQQINPTASYTPKMLAHCLEKSLSTIYNWINNGLKVSKVSRNSGITILGQDYLDWKEK